MTPAPTGFDALTHAIETYVSVYASTYTDGLAERLRDAVGIEDSFKAAGVDEVAFVEALPVQAVNAYEDQCAPANPRMPMIADMAEIGRVEAGDGGRGAGSDQWRAGCRPDAVRMTSQVWAGGSRTSSASSQAARER